MRVLLSTGSVMGNGIEHAMELSRKLGLDGIELLCSHVDPAADPGMLGDCVKSTGQRIVNVHMPFFGMALPSYVFSPLSTGRRLIRRAVRIADAAGAGCVVVHPFPAPFLRSFFRKAMLSVMKGEEREGIIYSVENMEAKKMFWMRAEPFCMKDYGELSGFCRENGFSMTLDTSHCASKGIDPLSFFEENAAIINNIHLSNFRGWQCHRQLWDGVVDMGRFLRAVSRHSYSGTLTLEINQEAESGIIKAVSFIKKNI